MSLPKIDDFKKPILDELQKIGGAANWQDIIEPVAASLGINQNDKKVMTNQGRKSMPKYIQRLRWASYKLMKEGKISRNKGTWEIIKTIYQE
jgi:restriction endonuclease Mrr